MHYKTEVEEGAKLLDKHREGWDGRTDLARLNAESSFDCVLAQEYDNDFYVGLAHLGLDFDGSRKYGFALPNIPKVGFGWMEAVNKRYEMLTEDWKELIRERRKGNEDAKV